ncbi:3-hydroxymethyl-3-methylglutaryl-CoA lyase [Colletotrichum filicis]|nr:3-hydroxymethyl-3-methylglutaryl-CoA lyase [Colletotrichum filicis]
MATSEVVTAEELGGAKIHASTTGLADQIAMDEFDATQKARQWVATLRTSEPSRLLPNTSDPVPPRYSIDDLLYLVNTDIRKPFDMREVLLRLVDDSRMAIFKPSYGTNMLTAWADILGFRAGIVANQTPVIHPHEALKAAQFIRLCNQDIILGASYGAGNYAMCGRSYCPRFLFTWPTGRCSVMGPDQLAGVVETIRTKSNGGSKLSPEQIKAQAAQLREDAYRDSTSYATSSMLIDDGIIDPRDTRDTVRIVEVGPRDGLQNIKTVVDTSTKLELIQRLQDAGLQNVEITSVVSPKAIPQLADCRKILSAPVVKRWQQTNGTLRMPVLVPNTKGLRIALEHGVGEVAVFVSATEGFSRANINCTVDESLERAKQVASVASAAGVLVRGYVSCIFADPFDGPTPLPAVSRAVRSLLDMGCYEVSLGDTLGVGTPPDVRRLLEYLKAQNIHTERLAGHFHDTYGQALANVWTAYECGLRTFDSSVGGLGGCPFAPGAKGNVATEDVVYLFQQAGVDTGVDLQQVVDTGVWISQALAKPNDSRTGAALASKSKISSTKPSSKITDRPKEALEWSILEQSDNVVVRRAGANGNIVLNKPRNGNTLTFPMISEIIQAFKSFESDTSISRVLISANGKFFCTGMDLSQAAQAVGQGGDASSKLFQALTDLFELIDNSPKVTIACIQGPAFGGGIGLAFSCDIRISISSASFTLSEAKLGMCPAVISRYVIREWGFGLSREAMLTARSLTASELKSAGAISMVAETPSELDIITKTLLTQLRHSSPGGSSMSKELVKLSWRHAGMPEQRDGISRLFKTMMEPGSDAVHGIAEFQQKPVIPKTRLAHPDEKNGESDGSEPTALLRAVNAPTQTYINPGYPALRLSTTPYQCPSVISLWGGRARLGPQQLYSLHHFALPENCRQHQHGGARGIIHNEAREKSGVEVTTSHRRHQTHPPGLYQLPVEFQALHPFFGGGPIKGQTDLLHRISMIESKLAQLSDRESQEFSSAAFNEANMPMEDHNTVEEQPQFQSNEHEDVLGVPDLVNQSSPNMSTTWRSGSSQSQSNAIEAYAREAWLSVLGDHMTVEDSCNLEVAQATNILAIIDFTAGRTSSAWLKIGMAIRIAQDLQLMKEPSETLPLVEQEERRRSFWSIYLLDKLVSLGKHRHFAILDEDCHVRLPCDELTFRSGGWGQNVTLRQLLDWSTDVGVESGFPVAILASSVLARCTRRLLHDRNTDETPPWDSKSEFASITSLLLLVESRLQVDQHPIRNVVDTYRLDDGVIDHPAMGHVIFARTVFHVCYCLLYHPFLVREQVRRVKCQVPSSFMRLASQKSYEHARDLVNLLHDAEAVGCHLGASFYAYSACLAGSILSLHMHTEKDTESQRYLELLSATQDSILILEGMAKFWDHASKIIDDNLMNFDTPNIKYLLELASGGG